MMLLTTLIAALLAALPATGATLQPLSIEAKVRPSIARVGEPLTYVLTVEGAARSEINLLSGAPQGRNMDLSSRRPDVRQDLVRQNGRTRRTVAFEWNYRPRREGMSRFDPVVVEVAGKRYRTEPVTVRVRPASDSAEATPGTSNEVFIEASLSDSLVYRGEQAVVSYRLFYRNDLRLRRSRMAGSWDAPGFWREELDVPSSPDANLRRRGGEAYRTLLLKRVAVFPTRTGQLTLAPLEIETRARRRRTSNRNSSSARQLLDRLFSGGNGRELRVTSDSVHLRARALPDGAPPSFRGAVGTFRLDLQRPRGPVAVGQAVELTLKVSGYGNLATLEAPALEGVTDGLETYASEEELSLDRDGPRVRGTKTFTYTIVPQEPGTFGLAPLAFSFFAPDAGRYQTLRTDPITIEARGTSASDMPPAAEALPPGDLAGPLSEEAAWTRPGEGTPLYRRGWVWAAFGVPVLLAAALLAWRRRAGQAARRAPRAHPVARRRLEAARRHRAEGRPRQFYEETDRALRAFVGQRLGTATAGQTREQLRAALTRAGVTAETQHRFLALLDECDRARFAPTAPDPQALETASDRAHRLVAALHEVLPSQEESPATHDA